MGWKWSQCALHRILTIFAILSLVVSIGGIALWAKNCYDVFLQSDARQNIRLLILHQVDKDLENILDEKVPGPKGHRGSIRIVEPPHFIPEFKQPIIFISAGFGIMLGQIIQVLLAIWLIIVVKMESQAGVRVWFVGTLLIVIGTTIGLILILSLSTFHLISLVTTTILIIFYVMGLCLASQFKKMKVTATHDESKLPSPILKTKSTHLKTNKSDYKPLNSPLTSFCAELGNCLL